MNLGYLLTEGFRYCLMKNQKNNHIENYNNEEFQYDMYHNDNYMNSISSIACDMNYSMLNKLFKAENEACKNNQSNNQCKNKKKNDDFTGNISIIDSSDFKEDATFDENDFNNEDSASYEEF